MKRSTIDLMLGILQLLAASLWCIAAIKHNDWLIGFVAVVFVALGITTLENYTLRKKLED